MPLSVPRHCPSLVAGDPVAKVTREDLEHEYGRVSRALIRRGADPPVTNAVLECFTDAELGLLIKDSAIRLSLILRKDLP